MNILVNDGDTTSADNLKILPGIPSRPAALLELTVSSKRVTLCVSMRLKENNYKQSLSPMEIKCELKASAIADAFVTSLCMRSL